LTFGFLRFEDIPKECLSPVQLLQVEAYLDQRDFVNFDGVRDFLSSLWYPLYFLDFETFVTAIPIYDGTRPYQQVPYQYSLHYLQRETSGLGHSEFLAPPNTDPRGPLVEKLVAAIPDNACVLAYNASFEKTVLSQLADLVPRPPGQPGENHRERSGLGRSVPEPGYLSVGNEGVLFPEDGPPGLDPGYDLSGDGNL
jgi:hypothetical protein